MIGRFNGARHARATRRMTAFVCSKYGGRRKLATVLYASACDNAATARSQSYSSSSKENADVAVRYLL